MLPETIVNKLMMIRYIQENGHLILEGTETRGDLVTALTYLRTHGADQCRTGYGIPIEALIPRADALTAKPTRRPRAVSVEITTESL